MAGRGDIESENALVEILPLYKKSREVFECG